MNEAQRLFYTGLYLDAAAMALALRTAKPDDLGTYELRTSAIHFQIKRLLGDAKDKEKAVRECQTCAGLITAFNEEIALGQVAARARVAREPTSEEGLFFLGKIDFNHVWLLMGTLGKRGGWSEYKEARRSIETVLRQNPNHIRARVANAWIEYIVDTRVPFGFKWVLGGGNKTKGLAVVREAAAANTEFYAHTEAGFSLWEMLAKDKKMAEAVTVARQLLHDFPENRELMRFIADNSRNADATPR